MQKLNKKEQTSKTKEIKLVTVECATYISLKTIEQAKSHIV